MASMPKKTKALGAVIIIVMSVAILCVYNNLLKIQNAILLAARDPIIAGLEDALGTKVEIESIAGKTLSEVVISGLSVAGFDTDVPVLSARHVEVSYSLFDIITKRKDIAHAITGLVFIEPELCTELPSGTGLPSGAEGVDLGQAVGALDGFTGFVSVRDGTLKVYGIPGLDRPFAACGINGGVSLTQPGIAGHIKLFAGDERKIGIAVTGGYDRQTKAITCDTTLSGVMPQAWLGELRSIVDSVTVPLPGVTEESIAGIRQILNSVDTVDLAGGKVNVEAHVRPNAKNGLIIRGKAGIAEADLDAAHITLPDFSADVGQFQDLDSSLNLAFDFQLDEAGLACQGKGTVSVEHVQWIDSQFGFSEVDAKGRVIVEFWKKAEDKLLSFEGSSTLDIPYLSAGEALKNVAGLAAGTLQVEGPVRANLSFAGKSLDSIEAQGSLKMDKGKVVAEHVVSGVSEISGDIGAFFTFEGRGGALADYQGQVRLISGSVDIAYPGQGIESIRGCLTGTVNVSGGKDVPVKYKGVANLKEADIALDRMQQLNQSSREGESFAAIRVSKGTADCAVEFEGEAPGTVRYNGIVNVIDSAIEVLGATEGIKSSVGEGEAGGNISFGGEYPGDVEYGGKISLLRGEARIEDGPPWLRRALGEVSGNLKISGNSGGEFRYSGDLSVANIEIDVSDAPGGIKQFSGEGSAFVSFLGGGDSVLQYEGSGQATRGNLLATEIEGGIRRLEGPVTGNVAFKGEYREKPAINGIMSIAKCALEVGEIEGLVKSISGEADGEIHFSGCGPELTGYSGRGKINRAVFVSDQVYPGLIEAEGLAVIDLRFSSSGDDDLTYDGKAKIQSATILTERIYPGLESLEGNVASELSFSSSDEGAKYEGVAKLSSGKVLLKDGIPGLDSMDGDISANLKFQGAGGAVSSFQGDAVISGGTLKAGQILGGVESIEGPARLEAAFSGGFDTAPTYSGKLAINDASFSASDILEGVKSVVGNACSTIQFKSNPNGPILFDGTAVMSNVSFAAGRVYPGIKELGGNGSIRLSFQRTAGDDVSYSGKVMIDKGILNLDSIGARLDNLAAEVNFDMESLNIEGATGNFGESKFEASGLVHFGKNPEIDITLKSKNLTMEDLGEIAVAGDAFTISGAAAVDIGVRGFYPDLELSGEVLLSKVRVEHASLKSPAENIEGRVKLLGNSVSSEGLTMVFMDSFAVVNGSVNDLSEPHFDMTVSLADIELSRAMEVFAPNIAGGMKGHGEVTLNLNGSLEELWVDGDFALSEVSAIASGKSFRAPEVKGKFRYGNNAITLNDTVIATMGGEIDVSGVVLLKKTQDESGVSLWTRLSLDVKGVSVKEAASYVISEDITTSGVLDAKAMLEVEEGSYKVAGSCAITSGSIRDYSFDNLSAEFRAEDGRITIDELTSEGPDGDLAARGVIFDNADFEMQVVAEAVDLRKAAKSFGYEEVEGSASFVGTISGKDKNISLDGLTEIVRPKAFGIQLDSAVGRIKLDGNTIHLSNASIRLGDAACLVAGIIELGREDPGFDLLANINGMPVGELASIAKIGEIPLKGQISGKVAIRGTVRNPEAEGDVRLSSGEISGIKLDDVTTGFTYAADTANIENLSIGIGSIRVSASGNVTREGKLDLSVNIQDFDLSKLPMDIPSNPVRGGIAGFEGKITGELAKPQVEGHVVARNVSVMDVLLPDVTCDLKWSQGEVYVRRAVIHDGTGTAIAEGSIGVNNGNSLNLAITARELDVKTALAIVRPGKNDPVEGRISGKVDVRGDLSQPAIELKLDTNRLVVGGISLESASLNAEIVGDHVNLKLLRLFQAGDGYFEATGSLGPGAPISLTASARHFDVSAVSAVLGWKYSFKGTMDLAIKAEGESMDPSVALSFRVTDGSVERLGFDLLAARMTFRDGVVTIEDGEIVQGRHKAAVHGKVPISKKRLETIGITTFAPGEELDVSLQMINGKLEFISMFYDGIEWAEGNIDIDLHVAGTLESPTLYGSARVNDGTIKLLPVIDVFKNLSTTVKFVGTQANIETLSCRLGDGEVNVSGNVMLLSGQGTGLDLKLWTHGARVNTGMFQSLVNSDIKLVGPLSHPLISGKISLVRAIVSPDTWSFGGSLPFDADLALSVATEGDLRVRTKIMDIPASGSVKLSGTLKQPQVSGRMEARRGWFAYFGNEFTIRQAIAEFTETRGTMPRLEVEAETTVGAARIFIGLHGVLPGDLALELSSSPSMTHDEILALLNYPGALTRILTGDVEGAFKEEIARIFEQELRLQVSGGIGRAFEALLALDEFRLHRGTSNELTLRVGKYLIDSFYLSYEKALGPESYGVLRFDYFYRPGVVFTGRFDEKGEKIFSIEARLKF